MGILTRYLQDEFARHAPPGWECRPEVPILPRELERLLGYGARADILLERREPARRLWIEFEVSRADPVANHAKFATAHLFRPQPETDFFLAMVSPHVVRGRRNLAASMVNVMRALGMNAFQTVLFPHLSGPAVQALNQTDYGTLSQSGLSVHDEINRAMAVSQPLFSLDEQGVYFAGDLIDVIMNLHQWNAEMQTASGRERWSKRIITYFVFDPHSRAFAPSKFCAYVPVPVSHSLRASAPSLPPRMRIDLYVQLDGTDSRFDGYRARNHLIKELAMVPRGPTDVRSVSDAFRRWLARHADAITVHPQGPVFLLPPGWFG